MRLVIPLRAVEERTTGWTTESSRFRNSATLAGTKTAAGAKKNPIVTTNISHQKNRIGNSKIDFRELKSLTLTGFLESLGGCRGSMVNATGQEDAGSG